MLGDTPVNLSSIGCFYSLPIAACKNAPNFSNLKQQSYFDDKFTVWDGLSLDGLSLLHVTSTGSAQLGAEWSTSKKTHSHGESVGALCRQRAQLGLSDG